MGGAVSVPEKMDKCVAQKVLGPLYDECRFDDNAVNGVLFKDKLEEQAFRLLRVALADSASLGTLVLAACHGDIHDAGDFLIAAGESLESHAHDRLVLAREEKKKTLEPGWDPTIPEEKKDDPQQRTHDLLAKSRRRMDQHNDEMDQYHNLDSPSPTQRQARVVDSHLKFDDTDDLRTILPCDTSPGGTLYLDGPAIDDDEAGFFPPVGLEQQFFAPDTQRKCVQIEEDMRAIVESPKKLVMKDVNVFVRRMEAMWGEALADDESELLVVNVEHIDTATLPTNQAIACFPGKRDNSPSLAEGVSSYHGIFLDSPMSFSLSIDEKSDKVTGAGRNDTIGGAFTISGKLTSDGTYELTLHAQLITGNLGSSSPGTTRRTIDMPMMLKEDPESGGLSGTSEHNDPPEVHFEKVKRSMASLLMHVKNFIRDESVTCKWDLAKPVDRWDQHCIKTDPESGNIVRLNLFDCELCADLSSLKPVFLHLKNIEALSLKNNTELVGDVESLGHMESLLTLDLSKTAVSGNLVVFAGLEKLTQLILSRNTNIVGRLSDLRGLDHLNKLYLDGTGATGELSDIAHLRFMTFLNLADTKVRGENGLDDLLDLIYHRKLRRIDVSGLDLTGLLPAALTRMPTLDLRILGTGLCVERLNPDIHAVQFPFTLIATEDLLSLSRIPSFEIAARDNLLMMQRRTETPFYAWHFTTPDGTRVHYINRNEIGFVSHRWLKIVSGVPAQCHPDNDENMKLEHLQQFARENPDIKYWWLDYICVPQEAGAENKLLAIQSLPHYVKSCSTFVALVHDDYGCEQRYTFDSWAQGGWCRLERMAANIPFATRKLNARGEVIGKEIKCDTKIVVSVRDVKGDVPIFHSSELEDTSARSFPPLEGSFGDDEDIEVPEDQRDRRKAGVLSEYLMELLDKEEKRVLNREQTMREAEKRFDEATYMESDDGDIIERGEGVVTWDDDGDNESKTEDGTWQVRASAEANRANERKEIDERDFLLLQRDQDVREGDDDSVGATSNSLTTWSSFGNDHGSYLPSIQSGGRNIDHNSEYSASFGQTLGPIPGSGLRGPAVSRVLNTIRDGVMAQPFPDDAT
jgi:hypothetical protein